MNAEIKSNNKILINRLNDNERLLLQNIYNESQRVDKIVKLNPLTDETGDFGGVFVEIEDVPVETE